MVLGHGYMARPAARNAMWKYGYDNPPNYNLMSLNAGGPAKVSSGGHSICGDHHDGPFEHMDGGKYANGVISQVYTEGQTIDIEIVITAHHKGEFYFFLCDLPEGSSSSTQVTQKCLNKHRLRGSNGSKAYQLPPPTGYPSHYIMQYKLPAGVTCSRCVLQWYWRTGNSPGAFPEEFWNCADIKIKSSNGSIKSSKESSTQKITSQYSSKKNKKTSSSKKNKSSSSSSKSGSSKGSCKSIASHIPDQWCIDVGCDSAYSSMCKYQ